MSTQHPCDARNIDGATVAGFGDEWRTYDQKQLDHKERSRIFSDYFSIFPWRELPAGAVGADIGCGSGRWAAEVIPNVGLLHLVDASADALQVARNNLSGAANVEFHHHSVCELPFNDESLDFAYSLGVLHHVPDTAAAVRSVGAKLKPSAPFLLYLYYAFDDSPLWFRAIWRASDLVRRSVSRLPFSAKKVFSELMACAVYFPLARGANLAERLLARELPHWPLRYYRDKSFYVMRTDAFDRFATRLEQRFTKKQIREMLETSGFERIQFSTRKPSWTVLAFKGEG